MTQQNPISEIDNQRTEKARMLITILGNEFTRNSSHPFFKSLTETAAKPTEPRLDQPDISKALRNLMSHLSSQSGGGGLRAEVPKKSASIAPDTYVSANQHPALIASSLAKMDSSNRRSVLRGLSGPLACRVLVYLREIEEKME
jgi:hypothetical protein